MTVIIPSVICSFTHTKNVIEYTNSQLLYLTLVQYDYNAYSDLQFYPLAKHINDEGML